VRHLGAPDPHVADGQLAVEPGVVEQLQRAVDGRRGGAMAEAMRDVDAPVPVVVAMGLRVDRHQQRRRLDVALLIEDPQIERESVQSSAANRRSR
jgi:hypothetical protein